MKQLSAPPTKDFDVYVGRPNTAWVKRDSSDSLADIYGSGFLPYSGTKDLRDVFYSARSARVALPGFSLTSENRRIAKKFDGEFEKERIKIRNLVPDETFWNLCLEYFRAKHGEHSMPRARLETILNSGLVSEVVVYKKNAIPVAYVLEVESGSMGHYWYSFYNLSLAKQSLGLWLMLDCIRDAQARGLTHYYLGTVYGEKALYKTNFKPLEWWNKTQWSNDIALLKERGRNDL